MEGKEAGPDNLRIVRAVEVLERIGGPEALALLHGLARGAPNARLTLAAQEAVLRLQPSP